VKVQATLSRPPLPSLIPSFPVLPSPVIFVYHPPQLAKAVEAMGAGEILLNAIDNDGKGQGFDLHLVESVSRAVTIPVIASSGAGSPEHFTEVRADAAVPVLGGTEVAAWRWLSSGRCINGVAGDV